VGCEEHLEKSMNGFHEANMERKACIDFDPVDAQ
jgi:hypothetical protein